MDRDAYLEAKKAKKARQKANKKKQTDLAAPGAIKPPSKAKVTKPRPRTSDDTQEGRAAARLSPEDRAALSIPQFGGALFGGAPKKVAAPPRGEPSPTYRPTKAGMGGKKEPDRSATEREFTCPSCQMVKPNRLKTTSGTCTDCQ